MAQTKPKTANGKPVGDLATLRADINLGKMILLGTFGTEAKPGALVRLPSGKIKKVSAGDSLGSTKVMTIGEGKVVLAAGKSTRILHSPGKATSGRATREPAAR